MPYYHDDSNETAPAPSGTLSGFIKLGFLFIVGALFVQTTLAANINLGGNQSIEFGQGVQQAVACSGSQSLTITPLSTFVNASGAGSYKFSGIRVDNIPTSCQDKSFTFSAYDDVAASTAQAIFNTSSSRAAVSMNSDNTFSVGTGGTGLSVATNSSSSFTVTFTTPVAPSSDIYRITIESGEPVYSVGDTGPGGGTVFYVSSSAFTVAESPCGTGCRYLEWAPNTWSGGTQDPSIAWSSGFANAVNTTGTAIGTGFANTRKILTSNPPYVGDTSGAAFRVAAYRGGGKSDWFLPSFDELAAVSLYARTASVGGFLAGFYYQSSSEEVIGPTDTRSQTLRISDGEGSLEYTSQGTPTRPIRAF
jgi:hypothetical protein